MNQETIHKRRRCEKISEISNQPTYKRQRFLLAFLRQLNDGVTATDLQKLVFLHTMTEGSDFYEFVPYKFGSYSFQLKEDLDILQRDGFATLEYMQDSTRIKAFGDFPRGASFRIAPERGNALIRRAYREYPYYAINSEITKKLFHGEELERFNNSKQAYTKTGQVLFTIGYEGKSIEAFINTLIQNDIRLLCDVRKNPLSRKFGFSKKKLEHITQTVGIRYVHIPDLGIDSDKRSSLETAEEFQSLFEDYAKTLPRRNEFLEGIYTLLRTNTRIALMCFEREPEMCHRHVIRDYIAKTYQVRSQDL
ncbi:DUF488 family protein [Desulfitobacterium chlororespirans]|uniref:DUF488 domain-containing protein n=1 Tax=Desulfitobacterium chlororespirans TaxID=51616 RepID=UPI0015B62483|nr:DUF488 domain-containing protein [Desulfitobacterium chlororespirans]